jgi:hypothetical protein
MTPRPLFEPGSISATPGALGLGINLLPYLERHLSGDWGDVGEEDRRENEYALNRQLRILSVYQTKAGKFWIITEADRGATTFLLPDEY